MDDLTYPDVGATRQRPLPPGYRYVHYRTRLGPVDFRRAADAVLSFDFFRAAGERVEASQPRAAAGVTVTSEVHLGPLLLLRAPCRVVWTQVSGDRAGFAYGTLPGHPARGEESFVVTREADGVWFTITSFSRPARWTMAVAGPVAPLLQRLYARVRARALRRRLR